MDLVGYSMTKNCADKVFEDAGFTQGEGRDQVGVIELHDCFAANEVGSLYFGYLPKTLLIDFLPALPQLITYPALGLCSPGEAHKFVERGDNTVSKLIFCLPVLLYSCQQYGGKYVVNPSGGLEAKGHPLGATGLGMHFYIMSEYWVPPLVQFYLIHISR